MLDLSVPETEDGQEEIDADKQIHPHAPGQEAPEVERGEVLVTVEREDQVLKTPSEEKKDGGQELSSGQKPAESPFSAMREMVEEFGTDEGGQEDDRSPDRRVE